MLATQDAHVGVQAGRDSQSAYTDEATGELLSSEHLASTKTKTRTALWSLVYWMYNAFVCCHVVMGVSLRQPVLCRSNGEALNYRIVMRITLYSSQ